MKKYFMYAAVASMMMVGCQNEGIVTEGVAGEGELICLNVTQGIESRTELSGSATHWSVGDEIYVTSQDGKVRGVLTYQGTGASESGEFKGYVFGGKATALKHVIFPVPEGGKVELKQPGGNKLDLPMFGEISGASAALNNVCAMVDLPVSGEGVTDGKVDLSEENGMLTGYYKYEKGNFVFVPDPEGEITVTVGENGKARFAAATTDNQAGQINLIVEGNVNAPVAIPVTPGQIETTNVPNVEVGEDGIELVITNEAELAAAFAKGGTYKLTKSFEVTKTMELASGITLTLDLNEQTLNSSMASKYIIANYGNLTLMNGTVTGNGEKTETPCLYTAGVANLNCTLISKNSNAIQGGPNAVLTIVGGHYESQQNPGGQALRMTGLDGSIEFDSAWELYITGGEFKAGWAAICMANNYYGLEKAGKAEIENAVITGGGSESVYGGKTGADIVVSAVQNITIEDCTFGNGSIRYFGGNSFTYDCIVNGVNLSEKRDYENQFVSALKEHGNVVETK